VIELARLTDPFEANGTWIALALGCNLVSMDGQTSSAKQQPKDVALLSG